MDVKFDFTKKMEDMTPEQMEERIKVGYEFDIPHKIVGIPFLGGDETVTYRYPELIGLCPATGYPDTYEIIIEIVPDKKIPELKSLKFYYMDYKDLPISHEHICDKIHNELKNTLNPKNIKTILKTTVRGGIYTDIVKEN